MRNWMLHGLFQPFLSADGGGGGGGNDGGGNDGGGDGGPDAGGGDKKFSQAELDQVIAKRLERERKAWQQQLEEEKRKAAMTEAEKLRTEKEEADKRAQAALQTANERIMRTEIRAAAQAAGIDPDVAAALIKDGVEVNERGEVTGVKEAVAKLLADKPHLKTGGAPADKSGGDFGKGGGGNVTLTLDQVAQMSPDEINRRWDEVSKLLGGK